VPPHPFRVGMVLIALTILSGCIGAAGPGSRASTGESAAYATFQSLLNDNPAFRQGFVRSCATELHNRPPGDRSRMASVLAVPEPFIETEFCTRVASLVASGRLTLRDFEALRSPDTDPATMERLL
jgi:hypothetical protein